MWVSSKTFSRGQLWKSCLRISSLDGMRLLFLSHIFVLWVIWATRYDLPFPPVCLSVCLRVGHRRRAEWGAAISGVCSAFINTSLLGDKLMSPGSLIATSQLLWVTSDTFFVLHHSGRSTSHAASYIRYKQWSISDWRGIFQRTEGTSRRRRSCSHSKRMFLILKTYVTMIL